MGVRSSLDDLHRGEVERLLEERRSVTLFTLADAADLPIRKTLAILVSLRAEGKVHGPKDVEGEWQWQ